MSSLPPSRIPYPKRWLPYLEQLALLQSRGLVVTDPTSAEKFLSHVGYYRLSGYCLAFEGTRHTFVPGTTFARVQAAYEFDRELRDLVTEALEIVEIDFRTTIAYHFGDRYGPFGHADPACFHRSFQHTEWIRKLREESGRSNEVFVTHFREHYIEYPDLPIWAATEIMSFGGLSRMFSGMLRRDQKQVAYRYGLQPGTLESWLHHLVYIRNLCAHHSRLWDRVWAIKPELPYAAIWHKPHLPGNDRLFSTLLLLFNLMKHCSGSSGFPQQWKARLVTCLLHLPTAPDSMRRMGFTEQWQRHPVWA